MIIALDIQEELLIYAFRYTLGRASYAPHTVIGIIKTSWSDFNESTRELFKREINEAFLRNKLGHDYDKQAWLSIVELPEE